MTRVLSQKMRLLTFTSIALLGFVHGYNLNPPYLAPYTTLENEPLNLTTFFQYFFSNGFLRFRIPLLFLISGYLYAYYDTRPYGERTKKRFQTLIIPYLLWSAIGLLITFLLQQFPYTADIVFRASIDQIGDNRPYREIGWGGIILRWLVVPISFQLWFVFVLFIYNAAYPFFRYMILRFPWVWFIFTGFLWLTLFNIRHIEGQGMFFFSLGIWLQKRQINIEKEPKWFSLGICWILFLGICIIKTFIAFEFEPNRMSTFVTLTILHQIAVIAGILSIWFSVDNLTKWWMHQGWLKDSAGFSFFIFGLHVPLLVYFMRFALDLLGDYSFGRLAAYILVPVLVIILCLSAGIFFKKFMPSFYSLLTGGRGF
jgi:fucose 4-O-acetylase-like acetyltransferase